ncbi:MAG: M24 family metallopeptidase [Acidobacteriota bacterium]|nr:M24 family metallopeptidase [Acidobacteriota bacterium]
MNSKQMLALIWVFLFVAFGLDSSAQSSKQAYETMRLIRREKMDLILPGAMRDNNVDMWIHVVQSANKDPLALDLGGWFEFRAWDPIGYYIFTDRGGYRIERIILGGEDEEGLYDISGSGDQLRRLVEERDPRVIAVNMSTSLPIANGLSHTAYLSMTDALGEKYSNRIISAENVITDFRVRRVQSEIVAFANALEIQRQIMEAALLRIEPGITTPEEIGWWAADQLLAQGIGPSYQAATLFLPYRPNGATNGVYQPGAFISWDMGIGYLNFGTDIKRNAYILRDGEKELPAGLKLAWARGMTAREILRKTFKVGRTAGESLEAIVAALEAADYVHTPSDDRTSQYRDLVRALGDDRRSGFSIDFHATGNTSVGDATAGPSMAAWRSTTANIMVQPNYIFSLEFELNTWVPEWNRRIGINFEDNAIVTNLGVEYLSPINENILIIR